MPANALWRSHATLTEPQGTVPRCARGQQGTRAGSIPPPNPSPDPSPISISCTCPTHYSARRQPIVTFGRAHGEYSGVSRIHSCVYTPCPPIFWASWKGVGGWRPKIQPKSGIFENPVDSRPTQQTTRCAHRQAPGTRHTAQSQIARNTSIEGFRFATGRHTILHPQSGPGGWPPVPRTALKGRSPVKRKNKSCCQRTALI